MDRLAARPDFPTVILYTNLALLSTNKEFHNDLNKKVITNINTLDDSMLEVILNKNYKIYFLPAAFSIQPKFSRVDEIIYRKNTQ